MKKLWVIVPLFIWACQNQHQSNKQIVVPQSDSLLSVTDSSKTLLSKDTIAVGIMLQGFNTIPSEVDGCSGLFKLSSCETNCNYVFATNLQGKAFVQVNNKIIPLIRQQSEVSTGSFHEVYSAKNYEVEIEVKEVRQLGEELIKYEGVIQLKSGGALQEYRVVGEIGC